MCRFYQYNIGLLLKRLFLLWHLWRRKFFFFGGIIFQKKIAFSFGPFRKHALSNNAPYYTIEVIWTSSNFLSKICLIYVKVTVKQGDNVITKENSAGLPPRWWWSLFELKIEECENTYEKNNSIESGIYSNWKPGSYFRRRKGCESSKKVDKRIVMHEMARCRSKWSGKQQEFGFVWKDTEERLWSCKIHAIRSSIWCLSSSKLVLQRKLGLKCGVILVPAISDPFLEGRDNRWFVKLQMRGGEHVWCQTVKYERKKI